MPDASLHRTRCRAGEKANRCSPVLRTTNSESRCCADFCEARRRRKEARHLAASRREQSEPAAARHGSTEDRSRSIAPVCARPLFLAATVGGIRLCCEERRSVRCVYFETRSRRAAVHLRRAAPRRLAVASHAPHGTAARSAACACFRQFSRQKSRSSVLCDKHTIKRGTLTFPLRASDICGH